MITTETLQALHIKAVTRDLLRAQADNLDQEIIQASMKLNGNAGNAKTPALGKSIDVIKSEVRTDIQKVKEWQARK